MDTDWTYTDIVNNQLIGIRTWYRLNKSVGVSDGPDKVENSLGVYFHFRTFLGMVSKQLQKLVEFSTKGG